MKRRGDFFFGVIVVLFGLFHLTGCSLSGFQKGISDAIMNNPDPETVKEAMPTFLVVTDSLIEANQDNISYLIAGAELYSAYSALFVDDPERKLTLANRARHYGDKAFCLDTGFACNLDGVDYNEFITVINRLEDQHVDSLYAFTISWLSWGRANSNDWSVIANLSKYQEALAKILTFDSGYKNGSALVYMGVLETLRPPSLGGKPEEGKVLFEEALALTDGQNLSAKVELAQCYARMIYNRELHDRLLTEVLNSETEAPGLTLMNAIAKRQARTLLESAEDYF